MIEGLDSIVDILEKNIDSTKSAKSDSEEIMVPRKCAYCLNNVICSVLPTFIGISRIGIFIGVDECKYYVPNNPPKNQTQE